MTSHRALRARFVDKTFSVYSGEKGRRIRELTSVVQKRFKFPEGTVELYAEKVANRGLCAVAQAESLRYKLLGGLAVRRFVPSRCTRGGTRAQQAGRPHHSRCVPQRPSGSALRLFSLPYSAQAAGPGLTAGNSHAPPTRSACYGVLRFVMESGAKGCEVIVSGKLRAQRAKAMKFKDGYMARQNNPAQAVYRILIVSLQSTRIARFTHSLADAHSQFRSAPGLLRPAGQGLRRRRGSPRASAPGGSRDQGASPPDRPALTLRLPETLPVALHPPALLIPLPSRPLLRLEQVKIMLDWDPTGKNGPKKPLPDTVTVHKPKDVRAIQRPASPRSLPLSLLLRSGCRPMRSIPALTVLPSRLSAGGPLGQAVCGQGDGLLSGRPRSPGAAAAAARSAAATRSRGGLVTDEEVFTAPVVARRRPCAARRCSPLSPSSCVPLFASRRPCGIAPFLPQARRQRARSHAAAFFARSAACGDVQPDGGWRRRRDVGCRSAQQRSDAARR